MTSEQEALRRIADFPVPEQGNMAAAIMRAIARAALAGSAVTAEEPIDMVLHCPACGAQHIDKVETHAGAFLDGQCIEELVDWDNPPHRSHLCHGCGHIWRPADVPTNGVAAIKTKGKNDSPIAALAAAPKAQPSRRETRLRVTMQLMDAAGPLPGMIPAFEAHFGAVWTDREWRQETATWAAAWRAALASQAQAPQAEPAGAVEALAELVSVKDLKERTEALHFAGPNGSTGEGWQAEYEAGRKEYIRRQPAAWANARAVLAALAAQPAAPQAQAQEAARLAAAIALARRGIEDRRELARNGGGEYDPSNDPLVALMECTAPPQAQADVANAARVIAWATDQNRVPANLAFTAGPERQAAYWIEWAEGRAAHAREPLPAFIRRDVEKAIAEAINPKGMSVHDGKARIGADRLQYLLRFIDGISTDKRAAQAREPLSEAEALRVIRRVIEAGHDESKSAVDQFAIGVIRETERAHGISTDKPKTRAQAMREAGYTRRPTWRSLPRDGDDDDDDDEVAGTDKPTGGAA